MASVSNLSRQLGQLGNALPVHVRRHFDAGFSRMVEVMVGELQEAIEVDVFKAQAEPSGRSWDKISPLTQRVRQGTGNGEGSILGGKKLPASFKRGGRGNVFKIKGKGFVFGSNLRAKRFLVARTFAQHYRMPRNVEPPSSAKKRAEKRSKAARIRWFMIAVAGVPAPAPGKQLTHPGRKIIYWTPRWEKKMDLVIRRFLAVAFNRARRDVSGEVARVQATLDSKHRTSEVG